MKISIKHTPSENWWLDRNNEILADPMGNIKICRIHMLSRLDNGSTNGKRIIKCVQALEGIDEPKEFIENQKKEIERLREKLEYCWNKAYILNNTPIQNMRTCLVDIKKLVDCLDEFKPKNIK